MRPVSSPWNHMEGSVLAPSAMLSRPARGRSRRIGMVSSTTNITMQTAIRNFAVVNREQFTAPNRRLHAGFVVMLQLISKTCEQAQQGLITHVPWVKLSLDGSYGREKLAP